MSQEDMISKLPECLISEILCHLSSKDAVRTSVLSSQWRNIWELVPDMDFDAGSYSNFDAFVSSVERFLDSHRESWIRKLKLRLRIDSCSFDKWALTPLIDDAVTTHKIQHIEFNGMNFEEIPQSIYTCETLVHLRLCRTTLPRADFVSIPCLKIIHLVDIRSENYKATLEKLLSGSPVLEDFTLLKYIPCANVLQVRSHKLKRIHIDGYTKVVIDAPLLQCLRTKVLDTKNFQFVSSGFFSKLDIDVVYRSGERSCQQMICDVLTDISRVRDLVIRSNAWKECFLYSQSGPVLQFRDLSRLNVVFYKADLEMLPTVLESCPNLESFILELVEDLYVYGKKKKEPKLMFSSTVPLFLVSSLKFVEMKRSVSGYDGETELIRYFLKNSTILEKLRLRVYYPENAKCAFLEEVVAMPRCSSSCEVHSSFIPKR